MPLTHKFVSIYNVASQSKKKKKTICIHFHNKHALRNLDFLTSKAKELGNSIKYLLSSNTFLKIIIIIICF